MCFADVIHGVNCNVQMQLEAGVVRLRKKMEVEKNKRIFFFLEIVV